MEFSTKMYAKLKTQGLTFVICGAALVSVIASTGCQSNYAGQTLPSAYFLKDDIQYFPKGPSHKLAREAAALQEARAESLNRR